jgi:hypothetical protein
MCVVAGNRESVERPASHRASSRSRIRRADRSLGEPKEKLVSDLTRRRFVKNSAGAAAGLTVVGALLAEQADADSGAAGSEPVVAYVRDPSKGEIEVMAGDREVKLRDPKLAARLARAAR